MTETRDDPARPLREGPAPSAEPVPAKSTRRLDPTGDPICGSRTEPVRYVSQLRAAARPSAIAQTMSEAPRTASPAANTPGAVQANEPSTATLPVRSTVTGSSSRSGD